MLTGTAYDTHAERLFRCVQRLHSLLSVAGVPYRITGGLSVFIHVYARDPVRARLTGDVDAAIPGEHFATVVSAAETAGWVYRRVAGLHMLVDAEQPKARSAVHL
jgi:hypothetical protein